MASPPERHPPANYWQIILTLGSLIVATLSLMNSSSKADSEALESARKDAKENERRICRLEAVEGIGECKR
jgi:hypothetical protein